jgi:hypothetical protein
VKGLEATLNKFILSLEFYDEEGRKKIAMSEWGWGFGLSFQNPNTMYLSALRKCCRSDFL